MSTFIVPSAAPAAASLPLTSSGPRGRSADEAQGSRFGDVLERSRAGARKSDTSPDKTTAETAAELSKPERSADKKDELISDLLAFALFAPPQVAPQAQAVATPGAGAPGEAKAAVSMATDVAADPLLAQAPATDLAEAGSDASALSATEEAAPEAKTLPAQAAAAQADAAKALPATTTAEANAADAAVPAAVGATPLPTLASAIPAAKAPVSGAAVPPSAAQQQAKAAPALPAADDIKTAPAPAVASGTEHADAAAAASPAVPTLVPASTSFAPQAVDRASAPASPTPVLSVAPPVGSDEWGPAIGQQMLRMSTGGHQVAELNLNPAGLGPLKVTLSLGDNQAQAMFVSAHESVRKAVEAALPQLRSTLAEQGISLGQTSVGAESRPWAGQGGFDQQPQQQRQSSRQAAYPGRADTVADAAAPRTSVAARSTGSSGLDTFA